MKNLFIDTLFFLLFSLLGLIPFSEINAQQSESIGMVTGPTTGTQIKFGHDIAKIAQTVRLDIEVKESQGSVDNIKRMSSKENAALGIVYADVLGFLRRSKEPEIQQTSERLRLIFPLYYAEAHLLAQRSIQTLNDLQGKRVIAGESGSGTWITTSNLLSITGVQPRELLNMNPLQGASAVLKGEADAMFFVVGKPVKLFATFNDLSPELKPMLANIHFVPLDDPRLLREYQSAQLSQSDYAWVNDNVPTVAVKAVLMSFDFSSNQNPYFVQRCRQLALLGQAIRTNIGQLRQNGHPKWKEVNLDESVSSWKVDICSREGKESAPADDPIRALEKELRKQRR